MGGEGGGGGSDDGVTGGGGRGVPIGGRWGGGGEMRGDLGGGRRVPGGFRYLGPILGGVSESHMGRIWGAVGGSGGVVMGVQVRGSQLKVRLRPLFPRLRPLPPPPPK